MCKQRSYFLHIRCKHLSVEQNVVLDKNNIAETINKNHQRSNKEYYENRHYIVFVSKAKSKPTITTKKEKVDTADW